MTCCSNFSLSIDIHIVFTTPPINGTRNGIIPPLFLVVLVALVSFRNSYQLLFINSICFIDSTSLSKFSNLADTEAMCPEQSWLIDASLSKFSFCIDLFNRSVLNVHTPRQTMIAPESPFLRKIPIISSSAVFILLFCCTG